MTSTLAARQIATRTVAGTDFPVTATLTRFAPAGRRPVYTVATVCNGIGEGGRDHRRLCDAKADLAARA